MAYDRKKIFEQAKELIKKHKLFFVEDVVSLLPISKPTFYSYYPPDSNEFNELKELIENEKVNLKIGLRSKWYKSNAPALQMALMKLVCTDEERKILSTAYQEIDHTTNGKDIVNISFKDFSIDSEEENKD